MFRDRRVISKNDLRLLTCWAAREVRKDRKWDILRITADLWLHCYPYRITNTSCLLLFLANPIQVDSSWWRRTEWSWERVLLLSKTLQLTLQLVYFPASLSSTVLFCTHLSNYEQYHGKNHPKSYVRIVTSMTIYHFSQIVGIGWWVILLIRIWASREGSKPVVEMISCCAAPLGLFLSKGGNQIAFSRILCRYSICRISRYRDLWLRFVDSCIEECLSQFWSFVDLRLKLLRIQNQ